MQTRIGSLQEKPIIFETIRAVLTCDMACLISAVT